MQAVDTKASLASVVGGRPWFKRGLRAFGIPPHSSQKSLREICQTRQMALAPVVAALERAADGPEGLQRLTLTDLSQHIVAWHHAYLRRVLPELTQGIHPLTLVRGPRQFTWGEILRILNHFKSAIFPHLFREEQVVFPLICELEGDRSNLELPGHLRHWLGVLAEEHEQALADFVALRQLTGTYQPPPRSTPAETAVLEELAELDDEMRWHMYAENQLLFPRALRLCPDISNSRNC